MDNFFNLNTSLSLFSILISFSLMVYFLQKSKKTALLHSFMFFLAMVFLWPLSGIVHQTLLALHIYDKTPHFYGCVAIQFFTMSFIGSCWLVFCLVYTNNRLLKNKWIIPFIFLISSIYFVVSMIFRNNPTNFTYVYLERIWVKLIVLFTFVITGIIILIFYAIRQSGYIRRQALLLVSGISIAQLVIIYEAYCDVKFGYLILPFSNKPLNIDAVPIGFLISTCIIAIATFKYKFLDLKPIARKKVFDTMSEAILVIDSYNKIDDFNSSFFESFSYYGALKRNMDAGSFFDLLMENTFNEKGTAEFLNSLKSGSTKQLSGELVLSRPNRRCFIVKMHPIYHSKSNAAGRVISFTDITNHHELTSQLSKKNSELSQINQELLAANLKLQEYNLTLEELTIAKERNRFARDIHDTLGHTMTVLLTLLKVSSIKCSTQPGEVIHELAEAIDVAQDGLRDLRRSVSGLAPEKLTTNSLLNALKQLFADHEKSGIVINFILDGIYSVNENPLSGILYRICQEALTNSIRHGNAKNITVTLKFDETKTRLLIIDDGCGCKDVIKGFGLLGMEERLESINGSLRYGSDGETGFSLYVEIPMTTTFYSAVEDGGKQ